MSDLAVALVAAQKEMPRLHKDSEAEVQTKSGGKYKYQYLSLESLLDQVLPVLNKHGLALLQMPSMSGNGDMRPTLRSLLMHESGESVETYMPLAVAADAGAQAVGSALTYARRYAILSMLALAPDEDDDGAAAQKTRANEVRNRQSSERGDASTEGSMEPRSEGFQAPLPATEKPVTQGVLDELKTVLKLLDSSFPEHPGQGRTWADVAKGHTLTRFTKETSKDLTLAEARELITWLEDQYQQAAREAAVPFGDQVA